MLLAAIAALLGSAATAYLIGYAFVAPRGSFWRSKRGVWILIMIGLSTLFLPPQLAALESAVGPLSGALGDTMAADLTWPSALGKTPYLVAWGLTSLLGLLAGMRVWKAGTPGGLGGASLAYDASSASRLSSLLPLADDLGQALDTIARYSPRTRDLERAAADLREIGRRFASDLPASDGEVYALVASKLPAQAASPVTGCLLEGAGRRARRA